MTSVLSRALPPPNNWQDFESLCFDLFSRLWRTNDVEMNGRRGQSQAGVDVYGTDRVEGKFAGVQCKGKEEGYNTHLTLAELHAEVDKAKTFEPPLDVFIVVTTASNDVAAQRAAREITASHAKAGLFEVRVQGWQTLRQRISDYPELMQKHFPDFAPFDIVERVQAGIAVTERESEDTRTVLLAGQAEILAVLSERSEVGDPLKTKIDDAIKLVEDGAAKAALRVYERLWKEEADNASPRNRYRLLANMGNVRLHLGDHEDAVALFKRAHAEDPDWPGARAILASAYLLEGDRPKAFELAAGVLAEDPTVLQAALVIIDAAPADHSVVDLEALIPNALGGALSVTLGLAMRARQQNDFAAAEVFARRAVESHGDDWRAMATLAEALFAPIAKIEGIGFTHRLPPEMQAAFDEALQLLRASWAIISERDDAIRGNHVAANLLSILDLAGLDEEAALVLDQALRIAPSYPPLLRRYAQSMAEAGDWSAAAKALEAIKADELEPTDLLLRVQAMIRTDDSAAALKEAGRLLEVFNEDRFLQFAGAMQLEAAKSLGRLQETLAVLLQRWPNSIILRSVAIGLLPQDDEVAARLAAELDQLVASIEDPRDQFHAAEALYRAKMFSRAADLYKGLHGTDQEHVALSRRLRSLYFADRRAEARTLFESLSEPLQSKPEYAELGVAIFERSGLLSEARQLLERQLAVEEDLEARLRWLTIVERGGDAPAVGAWLDNVSADQQGKPGDLIMLALAMDRHLGDLRSLPIAYRALRAGYGDPQIHLGYIVGLFLMGRVGRSEIPTPTVADDDVVVVLEYLATGKRLTRIIETEPDPRIERDEIAADHPLALRLKGMSVAAEIEFDAVGPEPARCRIVELHNKYVFAHFRTLETFPTMFPESRAFGTFDIDDAKGEERFKPLFDSAKHRHDFTEQLTQAYRSGLVPLARLAKVSGSGAPEVWESMRHRPGVEFQVALGTTEEFGEASAAMADNRSAVVDAITLYGLVQLGIAQHVKAAFEDLGVVQTSLDLLRAHLREQQDKRGTHQGTLGWDGENYRMIELTEEMVSQMVSRAAAAVEFAETLTLLPAEAHEGIKPEARDAFDAMDESFLDTVLAALGNERLMLCDDRAMRLLGSLAAGTPGIWTQAACKWAAEKGILSGDAFLDISGALADAGYTFTMVGHQDFLHELAKSGWTITPRIERFLDLLVRPANEPNSVRKVLAELMFHGWGQSHSSEAYRTFFARIFEALRAAQPDVSVPDIVQAAFNTVEGTLRHRAMSRFFKPRLLGSTYLRPVEAATHHAKNVAQRLSGRIAEAISMALTQDEAARPPTP